MKKKLLKKILSIFLIVVMVLGVTPIFEEIGIEFSFKSNAAKLDFGDYTDTPSLNEWRADCYSSHFDSTFMINDSPSYSGIFFESLNNDVSFRAGLASWDAICVFTSPGDVIETFSKQEYYDALLIDLLSDNNKSSFLSDVVDNYDSIKNGINNSYTKYIYSVTKTIIGEDKLDDSSEVRKILTMSPDYYIAKYLNEGEKIGRKVLVDTKYKSKIEFIDAVGDFFEFADTIETAIKCTCKYISINEAKDGTEQILKYIIKDQNNPTALRNAAYECWECFEEGFNGVIKSFINGTGNTLINKTVKTMLDEAYKGAWKKLATIYPGAESVLLLAKGTKILMKFFNVDVVAGAFYNLEATVNLEKALISCVNNFKNEYIETRSESAAVNYMSAISMYENMAQNSFDSSIDMLKAYIKTPIANIFWQDTVNDQTGETVEEKITEANKIIKEIETFKKIKTTILILLKILQLRLIMICFAQA